MPYKEHVIGTKTENPTSGFRPPHRKDHHGVDIIDAGNLQIKPQGVDIIALADGVVNDVTYDNAKGWTVMLLHAGNIMTIYQHLRENVPVKKGDAVTKGQKLGVMGNSGHCISSRTDVPPQYRGTHLHFAIKENCTSYRTGDFVNPELYLNGIKTIGTGTSAAPTNKAADISLAAKHAADIIFANEGNYGSVNRNDNGALSVGKVQWHGPRALSLLKSVTQANPMQAQITLGELYTEIINAKPDAWNKRTVNDIEAGRLSALLTTKEGKTEQDKLAAVDIQSYINKGISYGLKDAGALIYFADGVNQYGTNATLWKQIADTALKTTGDAAAMLAATKSLTPNYHVRREKVYKAICALNLAGTSVPSTHKPEQHKPHHGQTFAVGDKVRILPSAECYATTTTPIPDKYKNTPYTIQQVRPDRVLIQELYSWVWIKNVEKM